MKCKQCGLIEMRVTRNNGDELEFECPACGSIEKVDIKELTKK